MAGSYASMVKTASTPGTSAWTRGLLRCSVATALTMLITTVLASAGFTQSSRFINRGGLSQRASIIAGFAWLTALTARALQHAPGTRSATPPAA
jgi:hypothetical protein